MKAFFLLMAILATFNLSFSQGEKPETLSAEMKDGKVVIHQNNIFANCASVFKAETELSGNKLTIIQTDTSTQKAFCMCYFDIDYEFANLQPGNYTVELYRQEFIKYMYPRDTSYLVATLTFENTLAKPEQPITVSYLQGPCDNDTGIKPEILVGTVPEIIPNPSWDDALISFETQDGGITEIMIYGPGGNLILRQKFLSPKQGRIALPAGAGEFPSGAYFVRVISVSGKSGFAVYIKL